MRVSIVSNMKIPLLRIDIAYLIMFLVHDSNAILFKPDNCLIIRDRSHHFVFLFPTIFFSLISQELLFKYLERDRSIRIVIPCSIFI